MLLSIMRSKSSFRKVQLIAIVNHLQAKKASKEGIWEQWHIFLKHLKHARQDLRELMDLVILSAECSGVLFKVLRCEPRVIYLYCLVTGNHNLLCQHNGAHKHKEWQWPSIWRVYSCHHSQYHLVIFGGRNVHPKEVLFQTKT